MTRQQVTSPRTVRLFALMTGVGLIALGNAAVAAAQAVVFTVPVETVPNPCNAPEMAVLTGAHYISIERFSDSQGTHLRVKNQMTGNGYGDLTGDGYSARTDNEFIVNLQSTNEQVEDTILLNDHVISASKTRDFVEQLLLHVTDNASGTPTANVERFELKCKGGGASPTPVL